MEMFEIYNGSQWAHDIFLVNKAGATEYITGQSYLPVTDQSFRRYRLSSVFLSP